MTHLTLSLAGQVQRRQWRRRRRRLPATLMPRAARPPPPSRLRGDHSLEHSGYHAEIGAKMKQGGYIGFGLNQGSRTRDVNHKCTSNVRCGQTCRLARRLPWPACGTGRWRGRRARRLAGGAADTLGPSHGGAAAAAAASGGADTSAADAPPAVPRRGSGRNVSVLGGPRGLWFESLAWRWGV